MCGILGILSGPGSPLDGPGLRRALRSLFRTSESRGRESSGVVARVGDRLLVHKVPRPARDLARTDAFRRILDDAAAAPGPRCVLGHSRMATNGSPDANRNNHPLVVDGLVGLHNGIVTNDAALWRTLPGRAPALETDTEALLAVLAAQFARTGSVGQAAARTWAQIEGMASAAVLFPGPRKLLLATNTGSLHLYHDPGARILAFASETFFVHALVRSRAFPADPRHVRQVAPGTGLVVDLDTLETTPVDLSGPGDGPGRDPDRAPLLSVLDDSPEGPAPGPPLPGPRPADLPLRFEPDRAYRRCTRCILPDTMPYIAFDDRGVCSYCHAYRPARPRGEEALRDLLLPLRDASGRPDCIVSLSGGRDSSYLLHYVKKVLGMHPVAFSYDWGMMTEQGRRNQSRLCAGTGVEHILVSADIRAKRAYIRKNVEAWLRSPDLGTVPLFMAGDKQFYRLAYRLRRQFGVKAVLLGEHPLESTNFKVGFAGTRLVTTDRMAYSIPLLHRLKLLGYYGREALRNPAYLNASLLDTLDAFVSFYVLPHDYVNLYHYLPWDGDAQVRTLQARYGWEGASDSTSTWRIDDGTAAFYNYIYYTVAGLSEHDTFLSNLVREGRLTRDQALERSRDWNRPRQDSLAWYFATIGVDAGRALSVVNGMPPRRGAGDR